MALNVMTEAQLLALVGLPSNNMELISQIIHTLFVPRIIPKSDTAITIDETYRGGIYRMTAGTTVTVTLPATSPAGFLVSFIPYGAGAIAFSGTTVGGTGSVGQYKMCSAMKLDTGEWLISGGA